jgi:hypothetical protein
MAKTSRVTLDRQRSAGNRQPAPGATQAGVPSEEKMQASNSDKERPTLDEIAEEAYAIYMAHGSQDGFDIDHWLEAERRIAARKRSAANPPDVAADDSNERR